MKYELIRNFPRIFTLFLTYRQYILNRRRVFFAKSLLLHYAYAMQLWCICLYIPVPVEYINCDSILLISFCAHYLKRITLSGNMQKIKGVPEATVGRVV